VDTLNNGTSNALHALARWPVYHSVDMDCYGNGAIDPAAKIPRKGTGYSWIIKTGSLLGRLCVFY
jgi:hypothetical protein